ncbi:CDF family Co(II)/Ni(II) efflux transporter DmeF [Acidisoma cellulosilytica]|uniref:CDF family Co(II)/Ni(II) efflux transporter DmeF n=1 Tax=Acidisoma cellulosilyticum TaxID=2802395 RepID=A0A963YX62_9PROT|nr:CDF family Co(II)/Ni(II) efflux transporter DmeF [Acidisoma cellulosilyticum]MCB8878842.1 CDF family Co(II)/Ni(II) efflux transporter DmeF [Acidisoma cellulosilyticum]
MPIHSVSHSHVFLGDGHDDNKRRTWWVIALCAVMMIAEIVGGLLFGSIALVADGLHMSTHAGALLLAALAYSYASRHANDPRFTFGTGKLGDLAGFSSAIVLAMIALVIGYEAISRFFAPVPIHFAEAIPIACLGLGVNIASVWLLHGGGHHHHDHGHSQGHDHDHHGHDEEHRIAFRTGSLVLSIFEDGVPPRFRVRFEGADRPGDLPPGDLPPGDLTVETARPSGTMQVFQMVDRGSYLESVDEIPEPHAFVAFLMIDGERRRVGVFEEHTHHEHGAAHRDNNMRAAVVHVMADAAVSLLVIIGLLLARTFGWLWMDPLAGIIGACVIASWSYGLIRDTGAILLDMTPDRGMEAEMRRTIEGQGDQIADLHLWRLGPGHLGAILTIATNQARDAVFYRTCLAKFDSLSHVTIEVSRAASSAESQ